MPVADIRTAKSYVLDRGAPMFRLIELKPSHGWNAVAWELAIVTIGVLLALLAQQMVDELSWRKQVRQTDQALTDELADAIANVSERMMVNQCLRDRLIVLVTKLKTNEAAWKADPMLLGNSPRGAISTIAPVVYRAPTRTWGQSAWEAAKSSGVLNHMSREKVANYAAVYALMDDERRWQSIEETLYPQLVHLSFDGTLDAQARREALDTLGHLDWLNGSLVNAGDQLIAATRKLDLDFSRSNLAAELKQREATQRAFRGSCTTHFVPDV